MKKWSEILKSYGTFISDEIDLSSNYNYYVFFSNDYVSNSETKVEFYLSFSDDQGTTWGDWKSLDLSVQDLFAFSDNISNLKMKYMIKLYSKPNTPSPSINNFSLKITPYYSISNLGDVICKPQIWVKKLNGDGDIYLKNSTTNQELILKNLKKDEEIFIDCDNEDLITSLPLTYRFDDHNDVFLELDIGENLITGYGDFSFDIKTQFKYLQR
mgnify:CR=1 FL=1